MRVTLFFCKLLPSYYPDCLEMIVEDSVRSAHSGPSQRFLRGLPTTCLRRAPPPARVRGWTRLHNHLPLNRIIWKHECCMIVPAIRLPRLCRPEYHKTRVYVDNSTKLLNLPHLPLLEGPAARGNVADELQELVLLQIGQQKHGQKQKNYSFFSTSAGLVRIIPKVCRSMAATTQNSTTPKAPA